MQDAWMLLYMKDIDMTTSDASEMAIMQSIIHSFNHSIVALTFQQCLQQSL